VYVLTCQALSLFKKTNSSQQCGYQSYDDFQELTESSKPTNGPLAADSAIIGLANRLLMAGYISHARVSTRDHGKISELVANVNNFFVGIQRKLGRLRSSLLPTFSKPTSLNAAALRCLPAPTCRWLHLCLKKRPYATKLAPLHICKDDDQKELTDVTFFSALRKAYYSQRTWRDKILFKLRKIDFVEVRDIFRNGLLYYLP
jgi:hypothetical protein